MIDIGQLQQHENQEASELPVITQHQDPILPSYSNKVNIGEFAVGNYREF